MIANPTQARGFTLIELLIVILIIAILAAIAYPSYQTFIRNARLNNLRADMLVNAKDMERYYAQHKTFANYTVSKQNEFFTISVASADAEGYTLTSTANSGTNSGETRFMELNSSGALVVCTGAGDSKNCTLY